jgi:hypothetical protein
MAPTPPGLALLSGQLRRFFAASLSRSTLSQHASQARVFSSFSPVRVPPQPWWVLVEAKKRSAMKAPPRALGLMAEHGTKPAKAGVCRRAPKRSPAHRSRHPSEVEVFDHDLALGVHQLPHELVDGLPARCTHRRSSSASLAFARR